jgi:hypothetical protein
LKKIPEDGEIPHVYRSAIPVKIPMAFFTELRKSPMDAQWTQNSQRILGLLQYQTSNYATEP